VREIGDGTFVGPLAARKAIQTGRFRLFKVREGKDSLGRPFLLSAFRHLAPASSDRRPQNPPAALEWSSRWIVCHHNLSKIRPT